MEGPDPMLRAVQANNIAAVQRMLANVQAHDSADPSLAPILQRSLIHAVEGGCVEIAQLLLAKGVGQKCLDLALCSAVCQNHQDVAGELLRAGARLVPIGDGQLTALHYAAERGSVRVLELLLEAGADINSLTADAGSPLLLAVQHGQQAAVEWLLGHGADVWAGVSHGMSLMHMFAKGGHLEPIRLLLGAGVAADLPGPGSLTSLCLAAAMGHGDVVAALLAAGAHVDGLTPGVTPLSLAVAHGHKDVVQQLLVADANVSLRCYAGDCDALQALHVLGMDVMSVMACAGGNVLHVACWKGRGDVVAALLDHVTSEWDRCALIRSTIDMEGLGERHHSSFTPTDTPTAAHASAAAAAAAAAGGRGALVYAVAEEGATPLHLACRHGLSEGVVALFDRLPGVNAVTAAGITVMHVAVASGSAELVAELLCCGADMLAAPCDKQRWDDGKPASRSAWHAAAEGGDLGPLQVMLASVADINVRSADGSTALHVACGAGQEDAAMLLLLQGADPRAADNQGTTALERAAASGSERLVAVLLQRGAAPEARLRAWFAACDAKQLGVVLFFLQNGADVNAAGGDGRTAFHRSCTGLPDESAIALLAHAKEAGVELQGVTKALQEAVMFSSKRLVLALLDLGADMYGVTSHEHSAWHLAAQLGLTKKLQLFLDAGAQVDACKQGSSATALQLASTWGQADAARLLLQAGADVNAVAADGTPLHAAVRYKRLGVVSVLLAHGADMLSVPDCGRCMLSPWLLAAQVGSAGIIKLMLEHGAPVNTADASGVTALHIACQTAQAEAVALLLAAGADPQAATADGSTALHLTACTSCVQALLAAGADVHAVMHDGSTPLLCAAGRQDKPVLQCLLEAGANPTASHNTGWTPLHVAITGLWTEGLQLLLGAARNNVGGRSRSSSSSSSSSSSETCESKGGSAAHVPTAVSARNTSAGIQDFLDAVTADGVTPLHMAIDQVLAHWVPPNAEREAPYHPIGCQLALQIALLLLAEGAGVQTVTADGSTMLHLAACSRCVQLVEELLARGADVNAVAADGSTPLLYAVLCGEAAVVECLLRSGANPFTPCAEGWTALHAAASMVWYDGVWLLIEGADSWVFSRSSSCGGDSNLIGGAAGATPADAELQGFLDARTATGQTALHLVAVRDGPLSKAAAAAGVSSWRRDHWHGGERDVATLLLEAGANVDAVSDDGSTPLMCSVMSRDGALQSCLLTWGADPTAARKDGWTALHIAATCETSNRVQWLVEAVRSCDDSDSIVCSTAGRPLGAVAASPMMQDFLHARTASGHTALHLALANYHVGELIVLELLQAGASIDVLRGDPWWPQGADDKCPDGGKMVYALDRVSEFGPDPDVPWPPIAPKGTLLHWAVRQDWSVHLVELLVSLGADTAAVNAEGETPWHVLYKQAANEHTQQVGTLLATAACIDHTAHGQTLPGLVAHGKESLLCHSIKAVAGTLAAPGTVPQQLLAATCCKDVAQAAQLIRQGLAQCSRAASQQQVSAASCCPATRHQQLQQHSQPQQQQQPPPVMATQQVALEHATRVAVARSTAAAAAFLGGLVEVLGMQGCVSLLHRMLPACTHGGKARAGQAPATEDKEGPVAAARLLQEELFVQRLALAVLQAWLPEQRLRHDHTCRLQQLVPAARSASDCTLGTSCLVIDRSHPEWDLDDPDREDPPEEDLAFETAMRWVEDGRVADAGSQLVCLAEQGVDCAARLIRRKLSYSNSIGHLMICHALVAAWEVGHRKWLQALREAVVAAVRAS